MGHLTEHIYERANLTIKNGGAASTHEVWGLLSIRVPHERYISETERERYVKNPRVPSVTSETSSACGCITRLHDLCIKLGMVPLSTFSVVVPSMVPRVLRALFTFGNHQGVTSAFDEQLLGEAMAAPTSVDCVGRSKLSCDFCKDLITEAKLFPAAAQRRSSLREVYALFEGILEDLLASLLIAPARPGSTT